MVFRASRATRSKPGCVSEGRRSLAGRLAVYSRAGLVALCVGQAGLLNAAGGSAWQVDYSGDLNGSISGGIVVPGGSSVVSMVRGASMSKDMRSMGTADMSAKIMSLPGQAASLKQLDITLEDGTSCHLQQDGSETVTLKDASAKSYDVVMTATLACSGGKTVKAKASART